MLDKIYMTSRPACIAVLQPELKKYFENFPKPEASSLNQSLEIDWQLKLLYERIELPALKDIIEVIGVNDEFKKLSDVSWALLFLLCDKSSSMPTQITFFPSINLWEGNHNLYKMFFIHKKLKVNNANGELAISRAFDALQNVFPNSVLCNTLFKTFIAPELRDYPQYLSLATKIVIKQHPVLLETYLRFIASMPKEAPFVIDALADIALYIAHIWRPILDTADLNRMKNYIAKSIRDNFDEGMPQSFTDVQQRCANYIAAIIDKQGDSKSIRAQAKQDFLDIFIMERHESMEEDSKASQARVVQERLNYYLIIPGVMNRILEKKSHVFAEDMIRILEWDKTTFLDTALNGLLNHTNGVRHFSNATIGWLFDLPYFKQLSFIEFEQDNEDVISPDFLTVHLLNEFFHFNDAEIVNCLFLANRALDNETYAYPLFSALTRISNYQNLWNAVVYMLQAPDFHIMHYFDNSSNAFKTFPGVADAMEAATIAAALNPFSQNNPKASVGA